MQNRRPPFVRLRHAPHPNADFRLPNPTGLGEGCRYARPRDGRLPEKRNQGLAEGEKTQFLVAHYYVDPLIQDLALETGGCVGDSLEMARFGAEHEADTLVVAGVRFMGESAKILCPEKQC